MIRNIQLNHSGKYLCAVKTTLESLSAAADVIVRGERERENKRVRVIHCRKCLRVNGRSLNNHAMIKMRDK